MDKMVAEPQVYKCPYCCAFDGEHLEPCPLDEEEVQQWESGLQLGLDGKDFDGKWYSPYWLGWMRAILEKVDAEI